MRTRLRFILPARPTGGLLRRGGCWVVLVLALASWLILALVSWLVLRRGGCWSVLMLASWLSAQAQCFQGTPTFGGDRCPAITGLPVSQPPT